MKKHLRYPTRALFLLACCCVATSLLASPAGDQYRESDAELNKTYQKALKAMPSDAARDELRDAQRAWVAFRDKEEALYRDTSGVNGNGVMDHVAEMIDQRTAQLKEYLRGS